MYILELEMDCNNAHPVDFRHIRYGRPAVVSEKACYAEWHPEWLHEDRPFDTDEWEASACGFWFTDRESFRYAYSILRAFAKFDQVIVPFLPDGLAIGQIGTGKTLTIKRASRYSINYQPLNQPPFYSHEPDPR